uniref:Uncharacterized protein n=1 Tax=Rhizophora mucronata TaxID=61149 RepID=A0A2P2N4V9_RHIMU
MSKPQICLKIETPKRKKKTDLIQSL